MKKAIVALGAGLVLLSGSARADGTYVERRDGPNQDVTFLDDVLKAPGLAGGGARIEVRPSAVRMMLLRPRTQFVMEMLKSVQAL